METSGSVPEGITALLDAIDALIRASAETHDMVGVPDASLIRRAGDACRQLRDALAASDTPPERMFPIQRGAAIPWRVIAPFDGICKRNHGGQTLERIAERGGLGVIEAIDVLTAQPYGTCELPLCDAILKLDAIVRERLAAQDTPGTTDGK